MRWEREWLSSKNEGRLRLKGRGREGKERLNERVNEEGKKEEGLA